MSDTGSIMIAPSYTPHIPLEIQEQIFQYIAQSGVKCVRTLVLLNRAAHETFQPILHKHVILKASTTGTLFKYAIPTPPLVKSKEEVDLYTRQHNRLLRVLQSIRYLRVEDMKSLERIVNICIVLGNHKPTQLWKGAKGMITGSSILADMLREIKEYKHSSWQWPTCDDPRFGPIVRKVWNFFRYFKMADVCLHFPSQSHKLHSVDLIQGLIAIFHGAVKSWKINSLTIHQNSGIIFIDHAIPIQITYLDDDLHDSSERFEFLDTNKILPDRNRNRFRKRNNLGTLEDSASNSNRRCRSQKIIRQSVNLRNCPSQDLQSEWESSHYSRRSIDFERTLASDTEPCHLCREPFPTTGCQPSVSL